MKLLLDLLFNNNCILDRIELYIVSNKHECEFRGTFSSSLKTTTPYLTLDLELLDRFTSLLFRSRKDIRSCLSLSGFVVRPPINYERERNFAQKNLEATNQPFIKAHNEDTFAELEFDDIIQLHSSIRIIIKTLAEYR